MKTPIRTLREWRAAKDRGDEIWHNSTRCDNDPNWSYSFNSDGKLISTRYYSLPATKPKAFDFWTAMAAVANQTASKAVRDYVNDADYAYRDGHTEAICWKSSLDLGLSGDVRLVSANFKAKWYLFDNEGKVITE